MRLIATIIDAWRAARAGIPPASPIGTVGLAVGLEGERVGLYVGREHVRMTVDDALWLSDRLRETAVQAAFAEAGMPPVVRSGASGASSLPPQAACGERR